MRPSLVRRLREPMPAPRPLAPFALEPFSMFESVEHLQSTPPLSPPFFRWPSAGNGTAAPKSQGTAGEGLITYMRTDGLQMSEEALVEIRGAVAATYGQDFIPAAPRIYKYAVRHVLRNCG